MLSTTPVRVLLPSFGSIYSYAQQGDRVKEILQVLESRIKSPVVGYFTLAILIFNWQEIFFLFADAGAASGRITYFVENTSSASLFWYPAISAIAYTLVYPWVNLVFLYLCRKPTDLKNNLQASSEHRLLIEKNKLESIRSEYLATAEKSIIDQAKRDLEVNKIEDEELKQNVKSNIQSLRKKSSKEESSTKKISIDYDDPKELLKLADEFRERAKKSSISDGPKWSKRAEDLEEKAHRIISRGVEA